MSTQAKVYVLVKMQDGVPTLNVSGCSPRSRTVRAYYSKKVAQNNAENLDAIAVELDLTQGEVV